MSRSKRQIVLDAYGELALAADVFDLTPEELQTAASRLNSMLAVWETKGVHVGYNFSGGLDDESGLAEHADTAAFLNLAVTLAARKGKTLTLETKAQAKDTYELLLRVAAMPAQQQQTHNMPMGAGYKPLPGLGGQRYAITAESQPLTQSGDELQFLKA